MGLLRPDSNVCGGKGIVFSAYHQLAILRTPAGYPTVYRNSDTIYLEII